MEQPPKCTTGLPERLIAHPFHLCDVCQDKKICHIPEGEETAVPTLFEQWFHMDFGFFQALLEDYCVKKGRPRVVESFDGY